MTSKKLLFSTKGRKINKSKNSFTLEVTDNLSLRLIFLLWCIVIITFREVNLLMIPRLWAEEGKIFYSFARHHSLVEIFTTTQVGYLTLFNSIVSTVQAKIFPVEAAAVVATYFGFLVQLIPILIIVFTTHSFWVFPLSRLICLMIIIFTPPELWLNTTNSHFIFGLITFLILVVHSDQLSLMKKWIFRMLLVLGTLTGPASMLLTPVFFIKSYMDKTKEKFIQTLIITTCSIIQAIVIIYSLVYNNQTHRLEHHNFHLTVSNFIIDHFSLNLIILNRSGLYFLGIIIAIYFIFLTIKNWKSKDFRIFSTCFIVVAIFSTLGSLNMAGSPRYGFIPTCILMMLIAQEVFSWLNNKKKIRYIIGTVIFMSCLTLNTIYYKTRMQEVYTPDYPVWRSEVEKWRIDNKYTPRIHPKHDDAWFVNL